MVERISTIKTKNKKIKKKKHDISYWLWLSFPQTEDLYPSDHSCLPDRIFPLPPKRTVAARSFICSDHVQIMFARSRGIAQWRSQNSGDEGEISHGRGPWSSGPLSKNKLVVFRPHYFRGAPSGHRLGLLSLG